jgi:hypothetical protein
MSSISLSLDLNERAASKLTSIVSLPSYLKLPRLSSSKHGFSGTVTLGVLYGYCSICILLLASWLTKQSLIIPLSSSALLLCSYSRLAVDAIAPNLITLLAFLTNNSLKSLHLSKGCAPDWSDSRDVLAIVSEA